MTLFSLIGNGVPALAVTAGSTAATMGGLLVALAVLSTLILVLADQGWPS
jgi:hypothetical protein